MNGVASFTPPETIHTLPCFSVTNMRPSGAHATPTGEVKPLAIVCDTKSGGKFTAWSERAATQARRADTKRMRGR
jgi:hypothetical protein